MYDNRRLRFFPTTPEIDIYQIIREAQTRWLRPVEVIEILRNYQKFRLNPVPPNKPPSGSLFLFDRKTLRFFRKDGHNWRKKKDGKTVREAHERLKAGSVDVLHCYYAHGEDNANFQRRSYWMLEGAYEHIVLVHYREVTEGSRSSVYRSIQEANANKDNASQATTSAGRPFSASPGISDNNEVTGPYKSPEVSVTPLESEASGDEQEDTQNSPVVENQQSSLLQQVSGTPVANAAGGNFTFMVDQKGRPSGSQLPLPNQPSAPGRSLNDVDFDDLLRNPDAYLSPKQPISPAVTLDVSAWKDLLENFRSSPKIEGQSSGVDSKSQVANQHCTPINKNMKHGLQPAELQHMDVDNIQFFGQETEFTTCLNNGAMLSFEEQREASIVAECYKVALPEGSRKEESCAALKKLDSFGRWMSKEIGEDSQSSLLSGSSDHGAYWTLEDTTTLDDISSFSHQMNVDVGPGPSVSQDQEFSIADFSPEWAFSSSETKVIVVGNFLKAENGGSAWYCMFGEVEVPAEAIHEGVLRCNAPPHAPGRVPFYITRGNRLACSEVRDFEYRADVLESAPSTEPEPVELQTELVLMRLAKLISDCPELNVGDKAQSEKIQALTANPEELWKEVDGELSPKERVLENLLRQQLQNWLLCKLNEDGKGPCTLDSQGQGALHLVAALGYDWAIPPILASGVVINYRDNHGRTALHWAATFGRENVVSMLLAAGASPGLVTDPTPQYPAGRTPADLAASSGHKGMAGYLAEMSLTSHLTSLTLKEKSSEIDTISAVLAEEKAVDLVSESQSTDEEHVLLQDSLRAVRNAARAAALIHASFRQESFKRRQEKEGEEVANDYGMSLNEVKAMSSLGRHRKDRQDVAATKIQQKYRGWKGRKDFLLFRQRVVTIQAHVRGHQVRRKFKKLLWTVGILDKAVLRWRRKGAGLRKARAAAVAADNSDDDEVLRAGRKQKEAAVQKAVTRVQSMVRSHEAREQYQRIQDAVKNAVASGDQQHDDTTME